MVPIIEVTDLTKAYRIPVAEPPSSAWERVRRFLAPQWEPLLAVDRISFVVEPGEAVAFLGPNGAGKSTTIKMLTGILVPTSGEARVCGYDPHRDRYAYTYHIGVVMGQKSMLVWDIPLIESLRLYKDIYELDGEDFEVRLAQFSEMLDIDALLHIPVRKLSLGQRMRAEIVASLLHEPEVIFMDEPAIGLDLVSKRRLLDFIKRVNREEGVTVFLTTHTIPDVTHVCDRVILIDKGKLIYDGGIGALEDLCPYQLVEFELDGAAPDEVEFDSLLSGYDYEPTRQNRYVIRVDEAQVGALAGRLSRASAVAHVEVKRPDLECVLGDIYAGELQPEAARDQGD
jgi:ABC-2 type transport system ATP-binding protein